MCAKVNAWNSDGTRSHARERTNAPVRHNNIIMIYNNNVSESRGPETVDHRRQFNIILLRNANDDDDTTTTTNNNILILI